MEKRRKGKNREEEILGGKERKGDMRRKKGRRGKFEGKLGKEIRRQEFPIRRRHFLGRGEIWAEE